MEITSTAAVITGDAAAITSDQVITEELYEALNCSCAILGKDEPRAAPAPVGLAVGAHLGSSTQFSPLHSPGRARRSPVISSPVVER